MVGVPNPDNLVKLFWDAVNNPAKVSANLLTNSDVSVEEKDGLSVIVIRVPRASHDARPVFLDANPFDEDIQEEKRRGRLPLHAARSQRNAEG